MHACKMVNSHLFVHQFFGEIEATGHHLLAERHHIRRSRQVPRVVVPHPAGYTSTGLDLIDDQVCTSLTQSQQMHLAALFHFSRYQI